MSFAIWLEYTDEVPHSNSGLLANSAEGDCCRFPHPFAIADVQQLDELGDGRRGARTDLPKESSHLLAKGGGTVQPVPRWTLGKLTAQRFHQRANDLERSGCPILRLVTLHGTNRLLPDGFVARVQGLDVVTELAQVKH